MSAAAQEPDFSDWIGRRTEREDRITPRMIREYEATLAPYLAGGRAVQPALFWCLAPEALSADQLGPDGHPRTGIILPALPLPRRMWAGGELSVHGEFLPGDVVQRTSTIESVTFKTGSSGRLGFVAVRHHYRVEDRLVLDERQDIVYREPPPPGSAPAAPPRSSTPEPQVLRSWAVDSTPTLLFRYSALTFNGHRIHYDYPYATGAEGYAGLVVHGPLQATLMLNLVTEELGRMPRSFAYRGLAPLICGTPFSVQAVRDAEGALSGRVVTAEGVVTMAAKVVAG
jgi:3-methylfumaryl-CoA hydratase